MYWRLTPAVAAALLLLPRLVQRADRHPRPRRLRRAASSSPAAACLLTWLIAACSSHDARFSSRCVASGDGSPACSAIDHPFLDGRSLASADTVTFPPAATSASARSSGSARPTSTALSRGHAVPLSWHSSRLRFCCSHKLMIVRRLRSRQRNLPQLPASRQVRPQLAAATSCRAITSPIQTAVSGKSCRPPGSRYPARLKPCSGSDPRRPMSRPARAGPVR